VARFIQAISEGDGISLIPCLSGDVEALAKAADEGEAEAVAVQSVAEVERVRAVSGLPVLLRRRIRNRAELAEAERADADAVVFGLADFDEDDDELEALHAQALELEFDCAIEVHEEEQLVRALERLDPDIIAIANERRDDDVEAFERTLDLLPDVPAGKLVIAESRAISRVQVIALERAGVDAILIADVAPGGDFAAALGDLLGDE
jgi:indole-3-glycerol phosphate synthase